jgi:plasmid stabilization system protein ParE
VQSRSKAIIEALQFRASTLATLAGRGRVIPEFEDKLRREVFVHEWRLMYRLHKDAICILRVVHGRRLLINVPGSFEEAEQEAYAHQ